MIQLLLILICLPCFAFQTLLVSGDYQYEMYEPQDEIPLCELEEGLSMYYEAYLHPKLHEGIPLQALQIDESRFRSYEEFIADMFQRDFDSYQHPDQRHYYQVRCIQDQKIVAICAVLEEGKTGRNYMDHIGVHKDFRRQGIAQTLVGEVIRTLPNFLELSLDTRTFNGPAQALYEKLGFKKLEVHPNPKKQFTYCHYVYQEDGDSFYGSSGSVQEKRFHLALETNDLDGSLEFYREVFQKKAIKMDDENGFIDFFGTILAFHESADFLIPTSQTVHEEQIPEIRKTFFVPCFHFGTDGLSESEFKAVIGKLQSIGAKLIIEPTMVNRGKPSEQIFTFVRDPQGYVIELRSVKKPFQIDQIRDYAQQDQETQKETFSDKELDQTHYQ